MERYSIKMRASKEALGERQHISGAEKIVTEEALETYCARLLKRALNHSKGKPDFINLKIEAIEESQLQYLEALPVTKVETKTVAEGKAVVRTYLEKLQLEHVDEILAMWEKSYAMRGAMILNVDTLERMEPDQARGVRATYMDAITNEDAEMCLNKNHFNEALVLATKVANHPNIVGELCISDDPDYVTGYIASKAFGYVRITTLKPFGSSQGGRIFLFKGNGSDLEDCMHYLEKQKVLVQIP